ncbi:hypothetical protein AMECASPLE_034703 [Ameca splendens]|uniref:Uncharacterized protein n=1 Tax=Ameca splendens TaxID=208324 RepID=A0ABV0Z6X6_9TELE
MSLTHFELKLLAPSENPFWSLEEKTDTVKTRISSSDLKEDMKSVAAWKTLRLYRYSGLVFGITTVGKHPDVLLTYKDKQLLHFYYGQIPCTPCLTLGKIQNLRELKEGFCSGQTVRKRQG